MNIRRNWEDVSLAARCLALNYDQSMHKIKRRHVVDQCNETRTGLCLDVVHYSKGKRWKFKTDTQCAS